MPAATVSTRGHASIAPETQISRRVFAAAGLVTIVAWAVELHAGVITPWDRWLVPLLAVMFLGAALWIHRRPDQSVWPRVIGCIAFNAYLICSALMTFHSQADSARLYQLFTSLYWLPLGYASAFVFLPTRLAVVVSVVGFGAMFGPLGVALQTPGGSDWGPELVSLIGIIAVAQVGYIIVLLAVATMRAALYRDRERLRVTEKMVNTDLLTGLSSRRASEDTLSAAITSAADGPEPLTVMLLDVDHFKRINDTHGHAVGDRALTDVGRVLLSHIRAADHVGRWGGEEFIVLAPGVSVQAGMQLAERLRAAIEAFPFVHGGAVTVSIGVTSFLPGDNARQLLARADRALYRAKNEGRNRLVAERLALAAMPA